MKDPSLGTLFAAMCSCSRQAMDAVNKMKKGSRVENTHRFMVVRREGGVRKTEPERFIYILRSKADSNADIPLQKSVQAVGGRRSKRLTHPDLKRWARFGYLRSTRACRSRQAPKPERVTAGSRWSGRTGMPARRGQHGYFRIERPSLSFEAFTFLRGSL